ncbi:endo-1,4-beta-xylanase [Phormidium pseudopriestleyi FRX01]|uniref:Beta-xylanase n=1 Tax=Phormidium pseudopriestleyi FRX01 TaxID=1759528 RepID=A0ABS3FKZ2_9CYAN|nr:endo-1,4-beta-xylanase [Phormidium pseudopriestleyi]MBO0347752.1 endo-1,4-beta-xylanase [Phormidium pseudopriestleyi FRX01]
MKPRSLIAYILVMLAIVLAIATTSTATNPEPQRTDSPVESLRLLAAKRDFLIGTAVQPGPLQNEVLYREVLGREFNILMPENHTKFWRLHPERDRYDFSEVDAIVQFAQEHDIKVVGHALAWFHAVPRWVVEGNFSRDELMEILHDHIQTVVSHYRGQIYAWDVVNEPVEADGSLRETIWSKTIGPEYIDLALQWTREADPDTLLYINDYAEGLNSKSESFYNLAKELRERGAPLDAVGFQCHLGFLSAKNAEEVAENMKRYAELGLDVMFTEMDVPIDQFSGTKEEQLEAQAKMYRDFLKVCLDASNCKTLMMWGFTDRHTWLKGFTGGKAPLIFDESYRPKPAYSAMLEELKATE